MKAKLYGLFVAIFSAFSISAQQINDDAPASATSEWFAKAQDWITRLDYGFMNDANGTFAVNNNKNRLRFNVSAEGYSVRSLEPSGWEADFIIRHIGKQQSVFNRNAYARMKDNTLEYAGNSFTVQYINNTEGLRQNFIINQKQSGEGPLKISIGVSTSLQVTASNNSVVLKDGEKTVFYYDGLKVWDNSNTLLPASMEVVNGIIEISVNDAGAVYPITVDPLNRTPEWTTSADGILPGLLTNLQLQVQTLYGYTVAGLGDINGDGFDDVAVSAPTMADVITGTGSLTGVGAVFIYLGSPTGLPVAPSKVLQPTTAVTGALFGFSIDAGDISGDGKNDIIIGAPLDRYQTTAQGILGTTNVTVTAGKVYYYRSEDLFTAANPTPFLQIRLQGTGFFSTGVLGVLQSNVSVNPLFGFSVAVTQDLNNDAKADIVIGSPAYLGIQLLSAQSGAAFVYFSNDLATTSPVSLNPPTPDLLGIPLLPIANTKGLLFGYSVDGLGDYNGDNNPDVVVGAPAGIDLSSLGGIFSGQVLGGSAYIYNGKGNGIKNTIGSRLHAGNSGLLGNAANLFGYKVKGVRNALGVRNGNVLIGSPVGAVLSNVLNGLRVKAGQVHVFKAKNTPGNSVVLPDQVISSPRSTSILSILAGRTINVSLMYGASIDNMLDVNCDNIGDIIVGEPLSTAVPFLGADVVGGAAYVYLGNADGTYNPVPFWDLYTHVSPLLGVNATALLGNSVAGARYVKGRVQGVRALVGGPANALDFGVGLLNLGNTLGTLLDFTFDDNGLGKAYAFGFSSCNIVLPAVFMEFRGVKNRDVVDVSWTTLTEDNVSHYEVQRSADGVNFETIAVVFSRGSDRNQYAYTDKHPYFGNNFYRLKVNDHDGRVTYSSVVQVRFDKLLPGDVVVAPNPAIKTINIRLIGLPQGTYVVSLHNMAGQMVQTQQVNVTQHTQLFTFNKSVMMPSGVYWLNVHSRGTNDLIKTVRVFFEQ